MCGTHGPEMVHVSHPDAGEALVPRTALSQMDPRWQVVEEDAPAAEPAALLADEPETAPAPKTTRSRRTDKDE